MKTYRIGLLVSLLIISNCCFSQTGHLLQGIGAVNMSMGGASTGQPIDISGALQWNPAAISTFDKTIIKLDAGLLMTSMKLNSTVPTGAGLVSGSTDGDGAASPIPELAVVWGKPDSKHTLGAHVFATSGFAVSFPESTTNPINLPQSAGGFGALQTDYSILQLGITWAYSITEQFSIGVAPTLNYSNLKLSPNPTSSPSLTAGYPSTDNTSAIGFGGQLGVFFDSGSGFKAGLSYKTTQYYSDFEFDNTFLDGSTGTNAFDLDFPAIVSVGLGYSISDFDVALDYRYVFYENTDGFEKTGWTATASVAGFGWQNMSILSAGVQFKGVNKLPIRVGYTYNSNPVNEEVAFYSASVPAILNNAFQLGLSYELNDQLKLDFLYHIASSDKTSGEILSPLLVSESSEYGAVPSSEVSYEVGATMIMLGASYTLFSK